MNDTSKDSPSAEPGLVDLTSDIVSAYVCNNPVPSDELSDLIETVHSALRSAIRQSEPPAAGDLIPAVPIEKSVKDDYIVCLEDRRRFKSLKRHLRTHHNLTPEEYRAKWNLSWDYPMVAPNYGTTRSRLAKKMGFGKKTGSPK